MSEQVTNGTTNALEGRIQALFEDLKRTNESGNIETRTNLNNAISDLQTQLNDVKTTLNRSASDREILEVATDAKNFKEFQKSKSFKAAKKDEKYGDFVRKYGNAAVYDMNFDKKTVTGQIGVGADGGYGVPTVIEAALDLLVVESSPVRQATSPVTIGGSTGYIKLINNNNVGTGWTTETGSRAQTNAPTFTEVQIIPQEMYAKVFVSQQMLEDVFFDAEGTVISDAGLAMGRTEASAFVNGTGSGQPTGFLNTSTYTPTAYATTGTQVLNILTGGGTASILPDDIVKLIFGLPSAYRAGAQFAMSREVQQIVRLLKDSQNRYLWSADGRMGAGLPAQLLGYDVLEFNDMPQSLSTSATTYAITFANWPQFYRPVDRVGAQLLRDPFSNADTGLITYRFRKRVGGGIENGAAGITLAVPQ